MTIAIIGAGNVGRALAQALQRAGHPIRFGSRTPDPANPAETTIARAAAAAGIIILAIPFAAAADVIAAANGFPGKILIDATNPLGITQAGLGLTMGFTTSGAEHIAALAPHAKVFKTFNQTGFENMEDTGRYTARPVMFVAGDDPTAKSDVMTLVSDIGFEPIDSGALTSARLLEPFAMLWIELARKRGAGPAFAFAIQRAAAQQIT